MADKGRPSKYQEDYPEQAEKLCRLGATDADLADILGVDVATINRWKLQHEDFCASIKRGKTVADAEVVDSLFKKATTGADTTAMIFWLKNRRKDDWRDKHDHEHSGKDGNPIEIIERRIVKAGE